MTTRRRAGDLAARFAAVADAGATRPVLTGEDDEPTPEPPPPAVAIPAPTEPAAVASETLPAPQPARTSTRPTPPARTPRARRPPPLVPVAPLPLAQRPIKTTVQITMPEAEALDDLVRAMRRHTGHHVTKDTVWRALLVAASRDPGAVETLAALLPPDDPD